MDSSLGEYEIHLAREGFASIRHIASGEIMHSRNPPMQEARELYVEQSRLTERLRLTKGGNGSTNAPLILWDVGLGAAANAMAAILSYQELAKTGSVRSLQIVSFENDLDPLRLALDHLNDFPYLKHDGPGSILQSSLWKSIADPGLTWQLLPGDFLERIAQAPAPPDFIYYDMFSAKTCGNAWTLAAFRKLFEASSGHATELFTYSCSTAVRALMLAAGFYVARGRRTGAKVETTIALTPAACRNSTGCYGLLAEEWLEKWNRSRAKFPNEIPLDQHHAFEDLIRSHPQFSSRNGD